MARRLPSYLPAGVSSIIIIESGVTSPTHLPPYFAHSDMTITRSKLDQGSHTQKRELHILPYSAFDL